MGLRAANKPVLNRDGYATAIITRAGFGKGQRVERRAKDDLDVTEYQRFELEMAVDSTGDGPIVMSVYTGDVLNDVIEEIGKGKTKKPVYNRLTTICLRLNLVKSDELKGRIDTAVVKRVQRDLHDLVGKKVQFKLGRVEGKTLPVPVPDTLVLVE